MEKPFNKEELFTEKLIKQAGLSKPSIDFAKQVMTVVTAHNITQKVYQPLISKRIWSVVVVLSIICLAVILIVPFGNESLFGALNLQERLHFSVPSLKLSKTLTYAIGFLALFLVQIPFLKHYLGKQYR